MTYLHNITMRDNITVVAKVITDIYLALHSQENCMIYDMETENSEERDTMLNGVALDSIKRYVRDIPDFTEKVNVIAGAMYSSAHEALEQQTTGIKADIEESLSRRDFIRLSTAMYDLAQVQVRNRQRLKYDHLESTNN